MDDGRAGARDRAATRLNFFLAAHLVCDDGREVNARVRNLSAGGMMIDTTVALTPGTMVRAEIRGVGQVPGEVAWAHAGRVGISFAVEIDPGRARRKPGDAGDAPAFTRPIIVTERKLTEAARVESKTRRD